MEAHILKVPIDLLSRIAYLVDCAELCRIRLAHRGLWNRVCYCHGLEVVIYQARQVASPTWLKELRGLEKFTLGPQALLVDYTWIYQLSPTLKHMTILHGAAITMRFKLSQEQNSAFMSAGIIPTSNLTVVDVGEHYPELLSWSCGLPHYVLSHVFRNYDRDIGQQAQWAFFGYRVPSADEIALYLPKTLEFQLHLPKTLTHHRLDFPIRAPKDDMVSPEQEERDFEQIAQILAALPLLTSLQLATSRTYSTLKRLPYLPQVTILDLRYTHKCGWIAGEALFTACPNLVSLSLPTWEHFFILLQNVADGNSTSAIATSLGRLEQLCFDNLRKIEAMALIDMDHFRVQWFSLLASCCPALLSFELSTLYKFLLPHDPNWLTHPAYEQDVERILTEFRLSPQPREHDLFLDPPTPDWNSIVFPPKLRTFNVMMERKQAMFEDVIDNESIWPAGLPLPPTLTSLELDFVCTVPSEILVADLFPKSLIELRLTRYNGSLDFLSHLTQLRRLTVGSIPMPVKDVLFPTSLIILRCRSQNLHWEEVVQLPRRFVRVEFVFFNLPPSLLPFDARRAPDSLIAQHLHIRLRQDYGLFLSLGSVLGGSPLFRVKGPD